MITLSDGGLFLCTFALVLWAWLGPAPPTEESVNTRVYDFETSPWCFWLALRPPPPPPPGFKQLIKVLRVLNSDFVRAPNEAIGDRFGKKLAIDSKRRKMTLVLDLDETLVHSSSSPNSNVRLHGGLSLPHDLHLEIKKDPARDDAQSPDKPKNVYIWKRPHVREFLHEAAKLYEIVVYTAGHKRYAEPLIDMLDVDRVIRRRYYREHCTSDG